MYKLAILIPTFLVFGCGFEEDRHIPMYGNEEPYLEENVGSDDEIENRMDCKYYQHLIWYKDHLSDNSNIIELEVGKDVVLRPGFQILDSDVEFDIKGKNATLPSGLTINRETGEIYGIPNEPNENLLQTRVQYSYEDCSTESLVKFRIIKSNSVPKKPVQNVKDQIDNAKNADFDERRIEEVEGAGYIEMTDETEVGVDQSSEVKVEVDQGSMVDSKGEIEQSSEVKTEVVQGSEGIDQTGFEVRMPEPTTILIGEALKY